MNKLEKFSYVLRDEVSDFEQIGGDRWVFSTILELKPNCFQDLFYSYLNLQYDEAWKRDGTRFGHMHMLIIEFLQFWKERSPILPVEIQIRSYLTDVLRFVTQQVSLLQSQPDAEIVIQKYKSLEKSLTN